MPLADDGLDGAGAHTEGGQHGGGAMADLLERTSRWLAGRGRGAHADAGLLIDADGRAVGRRVEVAVDDGDGLGHEGGGARLHPGVTDGPGAGRAPGA